MANRKKTPAINKGKVGAFIAAAWGRWWVRTLIIIALILIIIRIILSPVATKVANHYLGSKVPGYAGHVDWIHFALIRGAYKVDSMYLNKLDSVTREQTPFASAKSIDLSLEWRSLFHGRIVGRLFFDSPVVKFTKDKVEPKQLVEDTTTFKNLLDIGMPLDVNRFQIRNGEVRYRDLTSKPPVDIFMTDIDVLARNLSNTVDSSELLPASVHASAGIYQGRADLKLKLNLLANDPTFEMKAECTHLNLPALNTFFEAYGKFTVEKGDFSVFSELAAKDGNFEGYVKPLMVDLKVLGPEDKDENFLRKMWEGIIEAAAWVLKNKKEDQLGTKIPLVGKFSNPRANIWITIYELLRNGFIEALNPSLDYEININAVGEEDKRTPFQKYKDKRKERREHRQALKEQEKEGGKEKH